MSSSYELATFSLAAVDDIMEVSSDLGHNDGDGGGDEDIDIDIDLTAGQADEDYVFEDATSNVGLDDDFPPQPSSGAVNDDPMADEDEDGGAYDEHGGDFVRQEDSDKMDHEALPIYLESAEPASITSDNGQVLSTADSGGVPEREAESLDEHVEEQAGTRPNGYLHGDEDDVDSKHEAGQDQPADTAKEDVSQKPSPSSTHPIHKITDSLNSPPATAPGNLEDILALPNSDVTASIIAEESRTNVDVPSAAKLNHPFSRQVVVVYQNSEYALFSSSESDDPDSFFLSDLSIAEQPLTNFFEAIRNVISDDIGDAEELYIVVEDLGLEIMESSGSYQDVTFAQIVILRNKLLQNEGVETPGPLHLHLKCRPNFALRFQSLAKSASEGKGLSEVVPLIEWDRHSISPTENLADHQDYGSVVETQEEVDESRIVFGEETFSTSLDHKLTPEPFDALGTEIDNGLGAASDRESAQQTVFVDVSTLNRGQALAESTDTRNGNGEYDEDGDLIDYSDEEPEVSACPSKEAASALSTLGTEDSTAYNGTSDEFISPCLKPLTCFCSKCMEEISANERAKEEEYRRHSKSRQAEENTKGDADDNSTAQQTDIADTVSKHDGGQELSLDVDDGVDYDDDDHGDDYVDTEHEAQLTNDEKYEEEGPVQKHDNEALYDEDANIQEDFGLEGSFPTSQNRAQSDEYDPGTKTSDEVLDDEIEFDDDDFTKSEEFQGSPEDNHITSVGNLPDNIEKESAEAIRGSSSAAGSESDKTLEKQSGSDIFEEEDDEINYDDDDAEQETFNVQPVVSELKVSPPAASGKRPRADEHPEDGMSTRSKGPKRPRS